MTKTKTAASDEASEPDSQLPARLPAGDVTEMEVSEIVEARYNPRVPLEPSDPEWIALEDSITRLGLSVPLVVNRRNKILVGGHQRLRVLKSLGHAKVPVIHVDLDDVEERALNIALNRIEGRWDNERLAEVLEGLEQTDHGLEVTGFDSRDLDDLYDAIDRSYADSFLDQFLTDDSTHTDLDIEQLAAQADDVGPEGDTGGTGVDTQPWVTMSFPVDSAGRDLVTDALRRAKQAYGVRTMSAALLAISRWWDRVEGEQEAGSTQEDE